MEEMAVYICRNCITGSMSLPAQWMHAGTHIRLKVVPCSGKIDAQYMMHALEGCVGSIRIITCPEGKCTLSQGNYRAQVRTATVRRLLEEIGADPESVRLIRCTGNETAGSIRALINETVVQCAQPLTAVT
jgi:F420-non-reducing hydrogenase iron-sulfur subunit